MAIELDSERRLIAAGERSTKGTEHGARIRPHYLLELDTVLLVSQSGIALQSELDWVSRSLFETPYVVARRAACDAAFTGHHELVAVGIRGYTRAQRFGAFVFKDTIKRIVSPADIVHDLDSDFFRAESTSSSAISALAVLKQRWNGNDLVWGPGGSVGFELATKRATISESSDLDIVIYADRPMPVSELSRYLDELSQLKITTDLQVETPLCAFSATEYVNQHPGTILLKTPHCPILGAAPWDINALARSSDVEP